MPAKRSITKQRIIDATLKLIFQSGVKAVNVRSIAIAARCSTQPIYDIFGSLTNLNLAVKGAITDLYTDFSLNYIKNSGVVEYKAYGLAYVAFAKQYSHYFKFLFMQGEASDNPQAMAVFTDDVIKKVADLRGLDLDSARLFHYEQWIFVHGIATMIATGYVDWSMEIVSEMMTDVYQGLSRVYSDKKRS